MVGLEQLEPKLLLHADSLVTSIDENALNDANNPALEMPITDSDMDDGLAAAFDTDDDASRRRWNESLRKKRRGSKDRPAAFEERLRSTHHEEPDLSATIIDSLVPIVQSTPTALKADESSQPSVDQNFLSGVSSSNQNSVDPVETVFDVLYLPPFDLTARTIAPDTARMVLLKGRYHGNTDATTYRVETSTDGVNWTYHIAVIHQLCSLSVLCGGAECES